MISIYSEFIQCLVPSNFIHLLVTNSYFLTLIATLHNLTTLITLFIYFQEYIKFAIVLNPLSSFTPLYFHRLLTN
jgi:hypothetical protein